MLDFTFVPICPTTYQRERSRDAVGANSPEGVHGQISLVEHFFRFSRGVARRWLRNGFSERHDAGQLRSAATTQ